ncbi:MAG TPA: Mur ligase family protein, partial [Steroidobacteraceae bacterium]|nr:Mur ligase family protein [Steroidobacteraceae bacterium]
MLETRVHDAATLASWEGRVRAARRELRWPDAPERAVAHETGASLALAAPVDQLFTATEVNEWALAAAVAEREPAAAPALVAALAAEQPEETDPPALDTPGALLRLRRRAAREANPRLRALIGAAQSRGLPHFLDDEALTLGAGAGGHSWPLPELPDPAAVDWRALRAIPTALVTGTNGKTTVVRLLAACANASGLVTGYCCTDGVFVAGRALGTGDYSGPAGARRVLRDAHAEAAILETARGGILRRGLAVARADVAVITSLAADHFGEYGVHDLDALAEVKLAVARALDAGGLLVVNGDDALLARRAPQAGKPLGWFAQDADSPLLASHRRAGGATAGVSGGHLVLFRAGRE